MNNIVEALLVIFIIFFPALVYYCLEYFIEKNK